MNPVSGSIPAIFDCPDRIKRWTGFSATDAEANMAVIVNNAAIKTNENLILLVLNIVFFTYF